MKKPKCIYLMFDYNSKTSNAIESQSRYKQTKLEYIVTR